MPTQELERDLRWFISEGSGLAQSKVIPGNSKGPREKDAYASLLLVDDEPLAYATNYQQPVAVTTTCSNRRAIYSLQFYREGAVANALRFSAFCETELAKNLADELEFRILQPVKYQRIDDIIGDGWEERALVNLAVDYIYTVNQAATFVDTQNWTIQYGDQTITGSHTP